jgi:uncharacterized cupin superfamily protein
MSTYLITSQEVAEMEGARKTRFRNPNAKRINKSLGDVAGMIGFGYHIIEVEPGHETTEHRLHHHEDECVFVLSGTATAVIGDEEFSLGQSLPDTSLRRDVRLGTD